MQRMRHFFLTLCLLAGLLLAVPALVHGQKDRTGTDGQPTRQVVPQRKSLRSVYVTYRDVSPLLDSASALITTEPSQAFDLVEEALIMSMADGNKPGIAGCYLLIGNINHHLKQYDLAVSSFGKSLSEFNALSDGEGSYLATLSLGRSYEAAEQYQQAVAHFTDLQQRAEATNNQAQLIEANNALARISLKQGSPQEATALYTQVLEIQEQRQDVDGIVDANDNLGRALVEQQQIDEAIGYYESSYELASNTNNSTQLNTASNSLGDAYRAKGDWSNELKVRQSSIEYNTKIDNKSELGIQNYEIGNIFLDNANSTEAIPYFESTIEISEQLGDLEKQAEALQTLSKAYEESGAPGKALDVYRKATALLDSIAVLQQADAAAIIAMNGKVIQKQQRIELLERERALSDKAIEVLRQEQELAQQRGWWQYLIIGTLLVFFIGALIGGYFIYTNARQKRIAHQLLALKSLRSQMNPHFIFNALNSVNSFIAKNDERSANKYLSDFSRLMRSVMENSQEDFVPLASELQILDLYLQLEHFRFKDKFDYSFEIDPTIDRDALLVPPMIVQPYLENAVWHGLRYKKDKGTLKVHIGPDGNRLRVLIEDNGIGRTKSRELKTKNQNANRSTGLRNIESRVEIINEMHSSNMEVHIEDLDAATKAGTRVQIWLPNNFENS